MLPYEISKYDADNKVKTIIEMLKHNSIQKHLNVLHLCSLSS